MAAPNKKPELKAVPDDDNLVRKYKAKIGRVAQEAADVRSELGNLYQEAEDAGLNRQPLKMALKIEKMDPHKSEVFLRDLMTYLADLGYLTCTPELPFAQTTLLDDVEPAA